MSAPLRLDRDDLIHVLKVAGYSIAAVVAASAMALLSHVDVDPKFAFLVPLANSGLVALERFFQDRRNTYENQPW